MFGIFLAANCVAPSKVQARDRYSMGGADTETSHFLSTASGIASPSSTTAQAENPAGLTYNEDFKVLISGASSNNSFSPLGAAGGLFLGNGWVGGHLGVSTFSQYVDNSGLVALLSYGLATQIRSAYFSFGVSGTYLLSVLGAGSGVNTNVPFGINLGTLINPEGEVRLGVVAYDLMGGIDAIGAGLAWDPSSFATVAVDGSTNLQFRGTTVTPGLSIHVYAVQLKASYGFALDPASTAWQRRGLNLGLGVRIAYNFHLQAYYNEMALYYAGVMFRI